MSSSNVTAKHCVGFPGGSDSKESACNAGDLGSIPGLGRYLREENGNPLHILAWRIPRTEEPSRLLSMVSVARVKQGLATKPPSPWFSQ